MGFISSFILPKEADFDTALQAQARVSRLIVDDLCKACVDNDAEALAAISAHTDEARILKSKNMRELLDVFIAPYDKESIYRLIVQLDWVALSVRHFKLLIDTYGISSVREYPAVFKELAEMAILMEQGVTSLSKKSPKITAPGIDLIYDRYDHVVVLCVRAMAKSLDHDHYQIVIRNQEILAQLRDIAKRLHTTADSLEDMVIKVT